jgi:hypothetical protein
MKAVLHLAVLLLFAVVACGSALAQDTVYVIQVFAPAPDAYSQPAAEASTPEPATTTTQHENTPKKKKERRRSSFYINGSTGFDYSYIYYNHRYYDERTKYDGSAVGFVGALTMGVLIRDIIAVHGTFEFARFDGEYDLIYHNDPQKWGGLSTSRSNSIYFDEDIDGLLFLGGPGFTVFPFSRRDNFMRWAYIDAKLLFGIVALREPLDSYYYTSRRRDDYFTVAGEVEVGKDWKVSDRTYIGFGIKWQTLGITSGDDMEGEEDYEEYYHHNHMMNSVQLLLRFNRK